MSSSTQQQRKDNATKLMEHNLNSIAFRQRLEKCLMLILIVVCILMVVATIYVYSIGNWVSLIKYTSLKGSLYLGFSYNLGNYVLFAPNWREQAIAPNLRKKVVLSYYYADVCNIYLHIIY